MRYCTIIACLLFVSSSCGYIPENDENYAYAKAEDLKLKCGVMVFGQLEDGQEETILKQRCAGAPLDGGAQTASIYAGAVSTSLAAPALVSLLVEGKNPTAKPIQYEYTASLNGEVIPITGNGSGDAEPSSDFVIHGFVEWDRLVLVGGKNALTLQVFPAPKYANDVVLSVEFAFDVTAVTY